jgi:GNAT superfamily N-acetyltransferase
VIEPARAGATPALSGAVAQAGLRLRPQTGDDAPFLEALYISVRWPELDLSGWPDAVKRAFLADQFRLQTRHYAHAYYDAEFSIIEHGGRAIGRLYLFRGHADHRIVDISLVPDARGKGFGSALLKAVMEEAAAARKTVSIHVEQFNPALHLYRRLGFVELRAEGPYLLMQWPQTG